MGGSVIPGVGSAMRLGRGILERNRIESRIEELDELFSTPATIHYKGMQRFEVATALCDAKLGLVMDGPGDQSRTEAIEEYLSALKREYDMVLEQTSSASATKAEVYALGLALKEVALSFDEVSDEFARTSAEAIDRLDSTSRSTLAELGRKADAWLAEQEREQRDHLREFDTLLTERIDEFTMGMAELRTKMTDAVANHHQRCEAAAAKVRADTAASMRTLKTVGVLVAISVLVAAVLIGRLFGS